MPDREMPYAGLWRHELTKSLGPSRAASFLAALEVRYQALYRDRVRYDQRALRVHLEENILPGLALYQTLRAEGYGEQEALQMTERLLAADLVRMRRPLEVLGRLPFFFSLLRALTPRFLGRNFPPQGWQVEWPDEGHRVVAFDMRSCFYLDALTEYGAPELTAVYCHLDDLIYEGVSPHVLWERTGTLARGDECCDFRFRRVSRNRV